MKYKDEIEKQGSNHQKIEILKETIHLVVEAEFVVMKQAKIGRIVLTKIISKHQAQKKFMRLLF
jgi:hypothetical protein